MKDKVVFSVPFPILSSMKTIVYLAFLSEVARLGDCFEKHTAKEGS